MKKFLAAQLIAIFLLVSPTFALAIEKSVEARIASREAKQEQRMEIRKEKIASREAVFKEKVQRFKDKKKAEAVTKINDKLNVLNKRRVEEMSKHVDKMSEILLKVTAKGDKTAVSQAQTAIDAAKAALQVQATQDYNITLTIESKVQQDARQVKQKLTDDLKATHQKVVEARQALAVAISSVSNANGGTNGS